MPPLQPQTNTVPATPPAPAVPPQVSLSGASLPPVTPPPQAPSRGRVWKYLSIALILVILLSIAGGIYYFLGRPREYTESEILRFIRETYVPSVVQVRCLDEDGGEEASIGSGIYYWSEDGGYVETNAHVVLGADSLFHGCNVYFPRASDGSFYDSAYFAGLADLYHDKVAVVDGERVDGIDFATIYLTEAFEQGVGNVAYDFPPLQAGFGVDLTGEWKDVCRSSGRLLEFGDKIIALGYPGIGGNTLTFTEGVVSGFKGDHGEVLKSSVSINQGNSGGITVSVASGCLIGVPTWTTTDYDGSGSNLGLILLTSFIRDFIEGLSGEHTYVPDPDGKDLEPFTVPGEFTIGVPKHWSDEAIPERNTFLATDAPFAPVPGDFLLGTKDGYYLTSPGGHRFTSPAEGALDDVRESVYLLVSRRANVSLDEAVDAITTGLSLGIPDLESNGWRGVRSSQGGAHGYFATYFGTQGGAYTGFAHFVFAGESGTIYQLIMQIDPISYERFLPVAGVMADSLVLHN